MPQPAQMSAAQALAGAASHGGRTTSQTPFSKPAATAGTLAGSNPAATAGTLAGSNQHVQTRPEGASAKDDVTTQAVADKVGISSNYQHLILHSCAEGPSRPVCKWKGGGRSLRSGGWPVSVCDAPQPATAGGVWSAPIPATHLPSAQASPPDQAALRAWARSGAVAVMPVSFVNAFARRTAVSSRM